MNTIAANQADRQIEPVSEDLSADTQTRWSTDDELLVWTVSRIEGGRRHGVERDCHVVYGLSRGFFVEQTRKFRASAEQCIEMLQQGKRAGTIQRKVALDSIIAVHSDDDTGRLHIRTLNGTHHLEPISNEEAEVLREIAAELVLRMPSGGASHADYSGPTFTERRRARDAEADAPTAAELAERERQALIALENSRVEDAPDAYVAPTYDVPVEALEEALAPVPEPVVAPSDLAEPEPDQTPVSTMDLQRIAAAVRAEMGPESEPEVATDLPDDIMVTGGVDITFDPHTEYHAAEASANHYEVPAEPQYPSVPQYSVPPATDEPVPSGQPGNQVAATVEPDVVLPNQDVYDRRDQTSDVPANFDRRQQRAMRRQIEGSVEPETTSYGAGDPAVPAEADPAPVAAFSQVPDPSSHTPDDSGINLPAGAVFQPIDSSSEASPAEPPHLQAPAPATPEAFAPSPHADTTYGEGLEDRRQMDDPNFPSVFDRRGAHPIVPVERPGWARFDDDEDDLVEEIAEPEAEVDEPRSDIPDGPPTLSMPTGGQPIGSGGAVGFNPDFDINPFR